MIKKINAKVNLRIISFLFISGISFFRGNIVKTSLCILLKHFRNAKVHFMVRKRVKRK